MTHAPFEHRDSIKHSKTLEDLAREQGVRPMKDPSELIGRWPGDVDDGFEEMIRELRQRDRHREEDSE